MKNLSTLTPLSETKPRAAHPYHRCMICNTFINRGERHLKWVYRDEASIIRPAPVRQLRIHLECPLDTAAA